jgi:Integrase core domain
VRFTASDRALLAALLHRLPRGVSRRMRLLVRPDTVMHWRPDLIEGRHAARSRSERPGRPPTVRSIRLLALRLVREKPGLMLAAGARRTIGARRQGRGLHREILNDAGIRVVLTGVRMPRMNAVMEGWVQTCRRELLDRSLIWNQGHLLHALREFETFSNEHRPHQGIANERPLKPLPSAITRPDQIAHLNIRRRQRLGGRVPVQVEQQLAGQPPADQFVGTAAGAGSNPTGSGSGALSPRTLVALPRLSVGLARAAWSSCGSVTPSGSLSPGA